MAFCRLVYRGMRKLRNRVLLCFSGWCILVGDRDSLSVIAYFCLAAIEFKHDLAPKLLNGHSKPVVIVHVITKHFYLFLLRGSFRPLSEAKLSQTLPGADLSRLRPLWESRAAYGVP